MKHWDEKLLITGSNGLLGVNAVFEAATRRTVVAASRSRPRTPQPVERVTFDVTDESATLEAVRSVAPTVIFHCAADTRVDYCEDHPEFALRVNALGARHVARAAARVGARLVYVSTDSVFDGQRGGYAESDLPNPINVYSKTKLKGEEEVRQECPDHLIVRVNMFGWNIMSKESLAEWVINSVRVGKRIPGFTDIVFAPLLTNDLAHLVLDLVEAGAQGTLHLGAHDHVSKFEFARLLCRLFKLDPELVVPAASETGRFRAPRPKSTHLNVSQAERLLGRSMPTVEEGLGRLWSLEENGYVTRLRSARETPGVTPALAAPVLDWKELTILVTGGTGSFGRRFSNIVLRELKPRQLIIYSRDELKQHEMRLNLPEEEGRRVRFVIGDVRDQGRLRRALAGVDLVVHAAALKQVPACEYNPFEAVQTNILGSQNLIDAAIDCGVRWVLAVSTDKAVSPANLYGATKLVAEKLFVQGNAYSGGRTRLSCVRYGNVVCSRGSIIPLFLQQRQSGRLTVTDERMTRFWITLEQAVRFVLGCLERMNGGEIFVPKIPSMRVMELAQAIAPECDIEFTGIRAGEKLHEVLVNEDEARHARELEDMFIIEPLHPWWAYNDLEGLPLARGYRFASDTNSRWLSSQELREVLDLAQPVNGFSHHTLAQVDSGRDHHHPHLQPK